MKSKILVIGFGYKMKSGKDTFAQMVIEAAEALGLCAERRGIGDGVKEECALMLSREYPEWGLSYEEILAEMFDTEKKERYRLLFQWWTDEGRMRSCPDYWSRVTRAWIDMRMSLTDRPRPDIIVIPDVRYVVSAQLVKDFDGILMRIDRPGVHVPDVHSSENELADYKDWNGIIDNDGDLDDLRRKAIAFLVGVTSWAGINAKSNTAAIGDGAMCQ